MGDLRDTPDNMVPTDALVILFRPEIGLFAGPAKEGSPAFGPFGPKAHGLAEYCQLHLALFRRDEMLQRLETKRLTLARAGLPQLISRWPATRDPLRFLSLRAANLREIGALRLSFLVCVILPTLIAAAYFGAFASKQYASEARFAIRTAESSRLPSMLEGLSGLSGLASLGAGGRSTTQDAFMVTDYIRSRTLIEDMGGRSLMEQAYARSDVDWWSRLRKSRTIEKSGNTGAPR